MLTGGIIGSISGGISGGISGACISASAKSNSVEGISATSSIGIGGIIHGAVIGGIIGDISDGASGVCISTDSRDGRFTSTNIFDWIKPKSDFKSSYFRVEYKAFSKDNVTTQTVRDCLPYDIKLTFNTFPHHYSIQEKCVRIWTLQSSIYPTLTQALYEDNKYEIKKYIPLIRGINKYLVSPTKKEYITYRGSHMNDKQFNVYKSGNIYRAPAFGATSENESVANGFKNKYSVKFRIPKNCWNAAPISHLSDYPKEKEVLLPAYTALKILNKSNNRIEVQVLDNKAADYGVESRFI